MVTGMEAFAPPLPPLKLTAPLQAGLTSDQVMTAAEVAELLGLPVSTVYYLARRGDIPASRFGRAYRFLRPRIEELLNA
jgi:excisionase family DNA binding protein